ncbi:hypothetical protein BBRI4_15c7 [Bifidobacterium breve]|mgnify:CR=1 FL=1|nr:Hypothetical protein NRBB52_1136 [Bifidobacterium breve]KND53064.1 hypothetical protein BBRI4_15c7 [Bifidobacterium breve]
MTNTTHAIQTITATGLADGKSTGTLTSFAFTVCDVK